MRPPRLLLLSLTLPFALAGIAVAKPVPGKAGPPLPPQAPRPLPPRPLPAYSLDGSANNLLNPTWGMVGSAFMRKAGSAYGDGISTPAGADRLGARDLSNLLSAQGGDKPNNRGLTDLVYVFGQFLDHDINLTASGSESWPILVPSGDVFFDPFNTGSKTMSFKRSGWDPATGSTSPRQQTNQISAWVDGSQIYGSDQTRASALREGAGGRLKTSAGNMLPFNTVGLPNANDSHLLPDNRLFLAGDVRANENPELIAMQTLWMREHNRLADQTAKDHPGWNDEQVFAQARSRNIAQLQAVAYNDFLPALLGRKLPAYRGYDPRLKTGMYNEFATAAFRFGHSLLDGQIDRLDGSGNSIPAGPISLRDSFFNAGVFDPTLPDHQGDIDPFLVGASRGQAQEIDLGLVDDVRNFLFGPPGSGGFDLAALNIQRGRDHGLADYNSTRLAYGLPRLKNWSDISKDSALQERLRLAYGSLDRIDLWVGGLAEDHLPGSSLGPTFQRIIIDQFLRLRDGDRLWYGRILPPDQTAAIDKTRLSDIIRRNTSLTGISRNLFQSDSAAS